EAEEIVERARKEADRLGKRAAEDLEKALERRQQQAIERIARAEAEALDEVRGVAVDVALDATRRLLAEKMSGKRADAMIDAAIEELPEKLG
ncbi:MAG: F0F1 ATP synthase subunit B, partial [Alphaproteobacteria bacterium]|nr:F0F1 ATP synthase subunit B [Alphaproteobacteria bacterium]